MRQFLASPRAPLQALALLVVAAAGLYAGLARLVAGPHVFGDELYYSEAATSLAHGHGLHVRGESYGFGPLYPALLALVRLVVSGVPSAYWGWMVVNAVAVALTAVPAYVLARRLLKPWWGVAVAALTVAVPSAFYAGAVMTDCLGYLAAVTALLAITLAVERATVSNQLVVLAAVAVATSVRTQFAVLYITFVGALLVDALVERRLAWRFSVRRWWPTAGAAVIAALVVAGRAASGRSVSSLLGAYGDLAHGYPVVATTRWAVEHVFDLALYLGLLGGVVAPAATASLYRRARAGSARDAAFLATFASGSVTAILLVAAFSSGQFGFGRLHDRYLFYVVPLWLVLFAVWVSRGAPRSRPVAVVTAAAFVVFVLAMPYARLVVPDEGKLFDGTGTAVLATVGHWLATAHGISGRWVLLVWAFASGAWLVAVPRRLAWTLLVVVAASFAAGGEIMWKRTIHDSRKSVFANQRAATRAWVDRAVPSTANVTLVTIYAGGCRGTVQRYSFLFTEFFNERIESVPYLGGGLPVGPPTHPLHVGPDGLLETASGTPLQAPYVVLPKGLRVDGLRLATGTTVPLVLWGTSGTVRITNARSDAEVVAMACM